MDFYRTPETGEIIRFDHRVILWAELRCDASTYYRARWAPIEAPSPQDAAELQPITQNEADQFRREADEANAAARGELLLGKTHPRTTFMLF